MQKLGDVVRHIRRTVVFLNPYDKPVTLDRAWCLWELYHTVHCGGRLDIAMGPGQRERLETALVEDFDSIMKVLADINVRDAETRKESDKKMIFDAVKASVGFRKLDEMVAALLRERWLLPTVLRIAAARVRGLAEQGEREQKRTATLLNHVALFLSDLVGPARICRHAVPPG